MYKRLIINSVDKNAIVILISVFQNDGTIGHRKRAYAALVYSALYSRIKRERFDTGRISYIYVVYLYVHR